jgi:hypothetical protein
MPKHFRQPLKLSFDFNGRMDKKDKPRPRNHSPRFPDSSPGNLGFNGRGGGTHTLEELMSETKRINAGIAEYLSRFERSPYTVPATPRVRVEGISALSGSWTSPSHRGGR